jgi:hypothetical protein
VRNDPVNDDRWQLFVGGPLDGQHKALAGRPARYECRTRIGDRVIVDEYILEPIEAERRVVLHLYRHTGMRMAEVVVRLMAAYAEMKK